MTNTLWNCLTSAAATSCCWFSVLHIQKCFQITVCSYLQAALYETELINDLTSHTANLTFQRRFHSLYLYHRGKAAMAGKSKPFQSGRSLFCCRVDMELRCKAGPTNPTSTTMLEYSNCMSDREITAADRCALCRLLCKITRGNEGDAALSRRENSGEGSQRSDLTSTRVNKAECLPKRERGRTRAHRS